MDKANLQHFQKLMALEDDKHLALNDTIEEIRTDLGQKIDTINLTLSQLTEEVKKKEAEDITFDINTEDIRGPQGLPGKDYVLTEQDKNEIATLAIMDIEVPVVEKVIEKTTVIKEVPIVTENVVEVAVTDTPDVLVKKINESIEKISADRIDGVFVDKKQHDDEIATLQNRTQLLLQIATQRTNTSSSSSSSSGTWTSLTPDGVTTVFAVSAEPKEVNNDGIVFFNQTGYTYAAGFVTFDNPPTFIAGYKI